MLLEGKNAIVWGAAGSVGGAVAKAFAREGAAVFLAGRSADGLNVVAEELGSLGGDAEPFVVDATDPDATASVIDAIVQRAGRIDVSFDALSNDDIQGRDLIDLTVDELTQPVIKALRARFSTAKAVAPHLIAQRNGVVMTITGGFRESFPALGGTIVAWAAIEALWRQWACELGPHGVRAVWLRTTGIPESIPDTGDARADLGTGFGEGITREQIVSDMQASTLLGRLPTLADVGNVATFLASDGAAAMTSTFGNITGGAILD